MALSREAEAEALASLWGRVLPADAAEPDPDEVMGVFVTRAAAKLANGLFLEFGRMNGRPIFRKVDSVNRRRVMGQQAAMIYYHRKRVVFGGGPGYRSPSSGEANLPPAGGWQTWPEGVRHFSQAPTIRYVLNNLGYVKRVLHRTPAEQPEVGAAKAGGRAYGVLHDEPPVPVAVTHTRMFELEQRRVAEALEEWLGGHPGQDPEHASSWQHKRIEAVRGFQEEMARKSAAESRSGYEGGSEGGDAESALATPAVEAAMLF